MAGQTGKGPPFFGKYRGKVTKNRDDKSLGRVRATVPDIYGENESGWALPALPYAGSGVGLFLIPPEGASVWIEFEKGDPDYPIWSGCFWAEGEAPVSPAVPEKKVLRTPGATITIDDSVPAGVITIETEAGMEIKLDAKGIKINNGSGASIKLTGPKVSINEGALEVT